LTGFDVRIISGSRTYAEQDQLFRKVPKVTNARGGQSNHNFGIAWDVGIFEGGRYLTGNNRREAGIYRKLSTIGLTDDLEWGGAWRSFPDMPHYQLKMDLALADIRRRFEAGRAYP